MATTWISTEPVIGIPETPFCAVLVHNGDRIRTNTQRCESFDAAKAVAEQWIEAEKAAGAEVFVRHHRSGYWKDRPWDAA